MVILRLKKFLSAFGSMLDISPRPHKPLQMPPVNRGIGRHFDAAFQYIEKAISANSKKF